MSDRLAGKVALITGGSRGMGAATARRFVDEGARVVLGDVLDQDGKALADELGESVRYLHLDVTSEEDWAAAVDATERDFGRLDVLVNNAGILRFAPIETQTLDEFRLIIDVNLVGTFLGMRTAIPALRRAGGGSIVNLSSTEGLGATLLCGAYTASKFGVRGITKVAALEHGKERIRVNSVHPGGIDTPMTRAVMDDAGRKYVASKVALKRMGTADDVADLITFLASDESSYCTGAEFVIDGGATASAGF
jgi:3alpha(or 20beta)-hydroxysteroid dehydrogenase